MFSLIENARAFVTAWKFRRTALGRALSNLSQEYFYSGHTLSAFDDAAKKRLIARLYEHLGQIASAPDPARQLREILADYVLQFAALQVLGLSAEDKAASFYSNSPYISGALAPHIGDAALHHEEMARLVRTDEPQSDADLVAFANKRSALALFYANGLNMARIDMGDTDPQNDWYRPFVEAMLVWEEDVIREKLSLPRLTPGPLYSLPYSTYFNAVMNGDANPFVEWRNAFPDLYLSGEGPLP